MRHPQFIVAVARELTADSAQNRIASPPQGARIRPHQPKDPTRLRLPKKAVSFGQDDEITVLTLTRLGSGQQSTTTITVPELASV
ncbi:MAG TPA: hypothetical protein VGR47_08855 [Terracidiphilus sp.]|nr:hypothetical protein [Terracidiphilus sp.]